MGVLSSRHGDPDLLSDRPDEAGEFTIDDRAGRDLDPLDLQVAVHSVQHHAAQIVPFQQMTEAADGRLIRHRCRAKVYTHEPL
jgi:hypothetical protein